MNTLTRKRSPGEVWEASSPRKSPRVEAKQKANEEETAEELQLLFQVNADELDDILWAI